jgi:hypothetical protein
VAVVSWRQGESVRFGPRTTSPKVGTREPTVTHEAAVPVFDYEVIGKRSQNCHPSHNGEGERIAAINVSDTGNPMEAAGSASSLLPSL